MVEHARQTRCEHGVNELDAVRKVPKIKESFQNNSRPSFRSAVVPLQFHGMTQIRDREPGSESGHNQLEQELLGQTGGISPEAWQQSERIQQQHHQQDTNDRAAN